MNQIQFSETLALKVVSLLLGLTLWVTILDFKQEEITKNVKLEPLLPPGMVITNKIPGEIRYTLSGPRRHLKEAEKRIQPIRPDLRKTRDTTIGLAISDELIGELPGKVKVIGFYPPNVLIRLEEVVEQLVPVKVSIKGPAADGKSVQITRVSPSKIMVSGPKSVVQSLDYVQTQELDVHQVGQDKEITLNLDVDPLQGLQLPREKSVKIFLHLQSTRKKPPAPEAPPAP